ncbi:MAG: hypothetical protein JW771_06830 [Candidatus Thermoplasmatota archaeon]|nr:hypothetical protein [Candidatus Thermoplasmatota archaeon]
MKYLFELSKEHHTLPSAELISCLHAERLPFIIIEKNNDVLVIDTSISESKIASVGQRMAFTFYIDTFLFSCSPTIGNVTEHAKKQKIEQNGSLAIRHKNRSETIDSQPLVQALASVFSRGRNVVLNNPDIEIRAYITDKVLYVGRKLVEINRTQFEQRKVQYRPFFSPISLHPKIARALVNLSGIRAKETLLDPFCGTGGILLEAGRIGAKVIGSDIEQKMVDGCRQTLAFYHIPHDNIFCTDVSSIGKNVSCVDAIVTDLPYGKATTTKGEPITNLYDRAFHHLSEILKTNGRAVIGMGHNDMLSIGKQYFSLKETHTWRAHRSLTRCFAVFEK